MMERSLMFNLRFVFCQRKQASHLLLTNEDPSRPGMTEQAGQGGQEASHPPFKQSKLEFGHSSTSHVHKV